LDEHENAEKKSSGNFMESRSVQTDETVSDLIAGAHAHLIARLDHVERLLADGEKRRKNDRAAAEKRFKNLEKEKKHQGELATRMNNLADQHKGERAAENEWVSTPAKGALNHIWGGETKISIFATCFMTPGTSELGLMHSNFCEKLRKVRN
jgi:hypothetical protein